MKQHTWLKFIEEARNAHDLRAIFLRNYGHIQLPQVHNRFFERIYFLQNESFDKSEIDTLETLKEDIEHEIETAEMGRKFVPPVLVQEEIPVPEAPKEMKVVFREEILPLAEIERQAIIAALEHCNGNRTEAAKALEISIRTLRNKLHSYKEQHGHS